MIERPFLPRGLDDMMSAGKIDPSEGRLNKEQFGTRKKSSRKNWARRLASPVAPPCGRTPLSTKTPKLGNQESCCEVPLTRSAHVQTLTKTWWFHSAFQITPSGVSRRRRAGAPLQKKNNTATVPSKIARFCLIKRIPPWEQIFGTFNTSLLCPSPLLHPPAFVVGQSFIMCNLDYDKGPRADALPMVFLLPVPAPFFYQKIIHFLPSSNFFNSSFLKPYKTLSTFA